MSHPALRHCARLSVMAMVLALASATNRSNHAQTRPAAAQPRIISAGSNGARVEAARLFTRQYADSLFSRWNIAATAAGPRCNVLIIRTSVIMEESMVEALHYGSGPYEVYADGVQRFFRQQGFRGVAYQDTTGRVWTYGSVTQAEFQSLRPCR